ncbi:MAG: DUF3558 family protein, partial [Bradymonadaceae bacterium]
ALGTAGLALILVLAAGCDKKTEADSASAEAVSSLEAEKSPVAEKSPEAAEKPAAAPTEKVAPCEMVTIAQATELLEDELREPRWRGASGLTLGRCSWTANDNGRSLAIWVYKGTEWDEADAAEPVEGLGGRAMRSKSDQVYVQPDGKDYFLVVYVTDTDGTMNWDLGLAGAKLAVAHVGK